MKNAYYKSKIVRPMIRAALLITLMVGPIAGFAAAAAAENNRDMSGAGFVLYMAIIR